MKKLVLNENWKKGELNDVNIKNIEEQLNDPTRTLEYKNGLEFGLFAFGYEVVDVDFYADDWVDENGEYVNPIDEKK